MSIDIVMLSLYDVFGLRCESSLLDSSPARNRLVTVYGQRKAKSGSCLVVFRCDGTFSQLHDYDINTCLLVSLNVHSCAL